MVAPFFFSLVAPTQLHLLRLRRRCFRPRGTIYTSPGIHSTRGGPSFILARSFVSPDHTDSIHQVAPASANGRTLSAAFLRLLVGVDPPATISNPDPAFRFFLAYNATSRVSSGLAVSPGDALYL